MKNYILILATIFLFGISVFFRKLTVDRMHPYQLQTLAAVVYGMCVPIWIFFINKESIEINYSFNALFLAFICLITNITGAILFGNLLKSSNNTGSLTILVSIHPIITFIFSMVFLGEQLTLQKIAACAFALAGLILFNL